MKNEKRDKAAENFCPAGEYICDTQEVFKAGYDKGQADLKAEALESVGLEYFGVTENVRNVFGKVVLGVTVYKGNQSRDGLNRENIVAIFFDHDASREFTFKQQSAVREMAEYERGYSDGHKCKHYLEQSAIREAELLGLLRECDFRFQELIVELRKYQSNTPYSGDYTDVKIDQSKSTQRQINKVLGKK